MIKKGKNSVRQGDDRWGERKKKRLKPITSKSKPTENVGLSRKTKSKGSAEETTSPAKREAQQLVEKRRLRGGEGGESGKKNL